MMSQWVGDFAIDTKQSYDQQLGPFTQDIWMINLIQVVRKQDISPRNLATLHNIINID